MIFNYVFAAIALVGSSISDIKTREVPDFLSISAIFLGAASIILTFAITKDIMIALDYILGFIVALAVALLMFHTGQWGGGDAKLIMAMGLLFGLRSNNYFFINAAILTLFVGAVYGLGWTIIMGIKYKSQVAKEFKRIIRNPVISKIRKYSLFLLALLLFTVILGDFMLKVFAASLIVFYYLLFYVFIFVKAVEKGAMIRKVALSRVTEGDWIAEPVVVNGKYICGPKDKGISLKQIEKLKKFKIKKVIVKYGMPFVPVFLIAFLINCYFVFIEGISLVHLLL